MGDRNTSERRSRLGQFWLLVRAGLGILPVNAREQYYARLDRLLATMRINLGVLVFITTIASGVGGALVFAGSWFANTDYQMEDHGERLKALHGDMVDVDRRINEANVKNTELHRLLEVDLAAQLQRVAVLEAQIKFLADRAPPTSLAVGPHR